MSTVIKANVTDQSLYIEEDPLIASGGINEDVIEFTFDSLWDNFTKTAVFYRKRGNVYHVLLNEDKAIIPQEVLAEQGLLFFGVFGVHNGITRTTEIQQYTIKAGAITTGIPVPVPTPSIYEQLLAAIEEKTMPSGGTIGQVLAKASDADYDFSWQSASGGSSDHRLLSNRDASEQHPISAITGLEATIDDMESELYKLQLVSGYVVDEDVAGLIVDYVSKTYTRIQGADGLSAGAAFDKWNMFGGRMRCNVADDGTINAWYGDADYAEDGSNGQVMVYQPKVYYRRIPMRLERAELGYHIRREALLVSDTPKAGFKLHPAFYDANGNEVDYVMFSAYEGCVFDVSANAYVLRDAQTTDFDADKISSISGAKPMSGVTQELTRPNVEKLGQNRGANWHCETIKLTSLNQLMMAVEFGSPNTQNSIESGITGITDSSGYNCASLTGSTSALGNATGAAASTVNEINGVETTYSDAGKRSVSYRGMENPWGNISKFVGGVNVHGDGSQGGGIPYICADFDFVEEKTDDNYESAGFRIANSDGYISAFGYGGEKYDWLFLASEVGQNGANSTAPVGDYSFRSEYLSGDRVMLVGGRWDYAVRCGGFCWQSYYTPRDYNRTINGRAAYVPVSGSTSHDAAVAAWESKMGIV